MGMLDQGKPLKEIGTYLDRLTDTVLLRRQLQCRKVGARRDGRVLHYSRSPWIIGDSRRHAIPRHVGFQLATTAVLAGRAHGALSRLVDCLPRVAAIVRRT